MITTCYNSIQLVNAQLESIDRKMRSVAIKRSESIKKKNQIESLISKNRRESSSKFVQSSKLSNINNVTCKIEKDDKISFEELSDTNTEYKKINTFLIEEIEDLKRENEFLKSELLKIHASSSNLNRDSLFSSSASSNESSNSLLMMMSNKDLVESKTNAIQANTCSKCDMSVSSSSSSGVVPQRQSLNPKCSTPMPITLTNSQNEDIDKFNEQHPPIDLSR